MRFLRKASIAVAFAATMVGSVTPATAVSSPSGADKSVDKACWNDYFEVWARNTKFVFQNDGNLVVYVDGHPKWASWTDGRGHFACFQTDGNLVVYGSYGEPLWASNTAGNPSDDLVVQEDGNLVIYVNYDATHRKVLWHTGTNRP